MLPRRLKDGVVSEWMMAISSRAGTTTEVMDSKPRVRWAHPCSRDLAQRFGEVAVRQLVRARRADDCVAKRRHRLSVIVRSQVFHSALDPFVPRLSRRAQELADFSPIRP